MYNSIFHLVDLFAKIDRSYERKCQPSFFLKDERKNDCIEPRFGSLPSDDIKRNFILFLSESIDFCMQLALKIMKKQIIDEIKSTN